MNEYKIFSQALDISYPWIISNINLKETDQKVKELHIHVQLKTLKKNTTSQNFPLTKRQDNFLGYTCYVHYSITDNSRN
ncbi:hypothetical protein [Marinifilum sp. D737]|uniref:hypothetical protein n=1 Tax=Marinifilum sp. D737 TaxID=2969628 RepID=UPI0022750055|nr:hypothetical protein [Marinifilum sp. D737]MCY1636438.1 hypothetical protein [Marinifilum sp. D737]